MGRAANGSKGAMNDSVLRPIETIYKGFRFRSRLEARWAVFFDQCGQPFEYEYEGYHLPSGSYLPDFYFPQFTAFLEVKPHHELPRNHFEFEFPWSEIPIRDDFPREIVLLLELSQKLNLPGKSVIAYGDPVDVFCDQGGNKRPGGTVEIDPRNGARNGCGFLLHFLFDLGGHFSTTPENLVTAAYAARSARFEHGERWRPPA
jgi:hypothetical protein